MVKKKERKGQLGQIRVILQEKVYGIIGGVYINQFNWWCIYIVTRHRGVTMALAARCMRRNNNTDPSPTPELVSAPLSVPVTELALVSDAELALVLVLGLALVSAPITELGLELGLALVSSLSSNAPAPTAANIAAPNNGALSNSPIDSVR